MPVRVRIKGISLKISGTQIVAWLLANLKFIVQSIRLEAFVAAAGWITGPNFLGILGGTQLSILFLSRDNCRTKGGSDLTIIRMSELCAGIE